MRRDSPQRILEAHCSLEIFMLWQVEVACAAVFQVS